MASYAPMSTCLSDWPDTVKGYGKMWRLISHSIYECKGEYYVSSVWEK